MRVRPCHAAAVLSLLAPASQASDCSLALILALDVSGSVDPIEDRLQREGLAQALLAAPVKTALLERGTIALFVFEWSMMTHQEPLTENWEILNSEADIERVAEAIEGGRAGAMARLNPPTAVGSALEYASEVLRTGPRCDSATIDISGDGENNDGLGPSVVYGSHLLDDVTVNALVIGGKGGTEPPWQDQTLVAWFEAEVLHGPGAFVIVADSYGDYARAMQMKLLRELELPVISARASQEGAS